jgi:hypothetical protein
MADTYRIYGGLRWSSQSGNAILALQNANGSGKKITLKSFEIYPEARQPQTAGFQNVKCRIARCSAVGEGGLLLTPTEMDTNGSLNANVLIYASPAGTETGTIREVLVTKQSNAAVALNLLAQNTNFGRINRQARALVASTKNTVESVTIRENEGVVISNPYVDRGVPLRVEVTFRSATRTFQTTHIANANAESTNIWGIWNGSGSGEVLRIVTVQVSELGDSTTPYFQLVPLGSVAPERIGDADSQINLMKYDTTSPTLTSAELIAVSDAACLPANGVPQVTMSGASVGSPKGVNYLNTKDFIGAVYRVFFAEPTACGVGVKSDDWCHFSRQKNARVIDRFGEIVLRPSEAIGLVSSAELATGTTAVSQSGYAPYSFAADITVEDLVTPTITLTGLPTGTRVCVVEQNTETLVNIGNESGGTFTYSGFTSASGSYFDIRILCAGYVFQQLNDVEKLQAVQTFAISLETDLVYDPLASEAITFSGSTKRIVCDAGNTSLDVPFTYSKWVDWAVTDNNLAYYHAFENQGGADIDISAGTSIPKYCYLVNSWRVRPQEADHTLAVTNGIILVDGGGDPFVNTLSPYTVRINYQQPVQAIAVSTGGGGGGATAAEVWDYSSRTLTSGAAPSAATVATAVRTELTTELARIDVATSTRLADADYTSPPSAATVAVEVRTELSPELLKIDELHSIEGLNPASPMTVTTSTRTAGAIDLNLTGDGVTTATVTRV